MTSSLFKPDDGPLTLICRVRYYDWSHCFSLPLVSFAMSRRPKQFKYKTTDEQCARNVRRCASRLEWRDRILLFETGRDERQDGSRNGEETRPTPSNILKPKPYLVVRRRFGAFRSARPPVVPYLRQVQKSIRSAWV